MTELLAKLGEEKKKIADCAIAPEHLAELVGLIEDGQISGKIGKEVFAEMFATGTAPAQIVEQKGLVQVSDSGELEAWVDEAIAAHPKSVADYRGGNKSAINFLKGQVMRLSKGKANPQVVGELLVKKLG